MIKVQLNSVGHFTLVGGGKALLASGLDLPTTSMTLTDFVSFKKSYAGDPKPIVQRKASTLTGDVPVSFTFTGTAPTIPQARVIKAVGGAVIMDWATLTSYGFAGSTGLGTLAGVPQGAGYLLQLRDGSQPANGSTTSSGAQQWGVGVLVGYWGQSNMVNTLAAGSYTDVVPGTSTNELDYWSGGNVEGTLFNDAGWHQPLGGTYGYAGSSSAGEVTGGVLGFLRTVSKALKTKYGYDVPVGMIPWAFNATGIEAFTPAAGSLWSQLANGSGSMPGSIGFSSAKNIFAGDFEILMWHQGEANAGDTPTQYRDKLILLYQGLLSYVAPFGRTAANFFFGPVVLGNYDTTAGSSVENIRQGVIDFQTYAAANAWPNAQIGWTTIDCQRAAGDPLHFDDSYRGRLKSMRRSIQSVLYFLGCATFSGKGPRIASASRTGLVATLTVAHEGGTALQLATPGSQIKGFYANTLANFTGTDIAVTAALTASNTQIAVTFPGGTTFPAYLKYLGGRVGSTAVDSDGYTASCNPNITNPVYDNVSYPAGATGTDLEPLGLPLLPTPTAILVN